MWNRVVAGVLTKRELVAVDREEPEHQAFEESEVEDEVDEDEDLAALGLLQIMQRLLVVELGCEGGGDVEEAVT